jgi:adenylate kinase family enzyme
MHKKILIIGEAGRGKSTLARKLSEKTGIEHLQTDDFFWKVKYSEPHPREEALEKIKTEYQKEQWIVEGTTSWLIEPGLELADVIVFLHFRNLLAQWISIIKREFQEKRGNPKEALGLLKHVMYKRYGWAYKKGKITHRELVEPYKDKVVVLDSFKKIEEFLEKI